MQIALALREAGRLYPGRELAGSPFTYPFYRLRDYLHSVRVSVEQTRDEVRASRVELAAHLTRLEAIASAQLEQLEKLAAADEAASASGPGEPRDVGRPEEG